MRSLWRKVLVKSVLAMITMVKNEPGWRRNSHQNTPAVFLAKLAIDAQEVMSRQSPEGDKPKGN